MPMDTNGYKASGKTETRSTGDLLLMEPISKNIDRHAAL